MTLRATDEDGRVGRRQVVLKCGVAIGDFLVRMDKAIYTAGDSATLRVFGHGNEPVFVDLIKDGQTMLTDVIRVADYIFASGARPACLDAADANDDGTVSISDALYLIMYLFQDGPLPPAPFQGTGGALEPGLDPTFLDGLSC